jgi:hypothetical protein
MLLFPELGLLSCVWFWPIATQAVRPVSEPSGRPGNLSHNSAQFPFRLTCVNRPRELRVYGTIENSQGKSKAAVRPLWAPATTAATGPATRAAYRTPSFFCRLEDEVVYWNTRRLSGYT